MKFSREVVINAPAEKVWEVYGRGFAKIGEWATGVSHSVAIDELPSVNNSPVGGRICTTTFGKVSEEFTAYDDVKKTLSFNGVFRSKMFKSVVNSSEITAKDENTSTVKVTSDIELTFLGFIMSPFIRMQLNKTINQIFSDLQYYVENGKPSPSKLAAMKK